MYGIPVGIRVIAAPADGTGGHKMMLIDLPKAVPFRGLCYPHGSGWSTEVGPQLVELYARF
jgi:hypothetical protein